MKKPIDVAKEVLEVESRAVRNLIEKLDSNFEQAVELLFNCRGRVVLTGVGKSGLIARKIAATLSSTGTPAIFMHAADAVHGDLGVITSEDVILAISYSGETDEIKKLLNFIKRIGVKLIAITGNRRSALARHADIVLDSSVDREACPLGLVPTSSTTAALALGDALAIALMVKKNFTSDDFAMVHPGGSLGRRLLKVKHLMHTGDELPVVHVDDSMKKVIEIMTEKKFGTAAVVDDSFKIAGIITDGDLRRGLLRDPAMLEKKARDFMTPNPVVIDEEELATKALNLMEKRKITCLLVPDKEGRLKGLIHLHDLWRTEMF